MSTPESTPIDIHELRRRLETNLESLRLDVRDRSRSLTERAVFWGMARGHLSALWCTGLINDAEHERRNAELQEALWWDNRCE